MAPLFGVCKGFVVIVGKGCKGFGGLMLVICDLKDRLRWVSCEGWVFDKVREKAKLLIFNLNKGVLWLKLRFVLFEGRGDF